MPDSLTPRPISRFSMRRFFWLPLGLAAALVLLVLVALVAMSWRSLDRLTPVQEHLAHITRIQDVGLTMEQDLLKALRGTDVSRVELGKLRKQILEIVSLEGAMDPQSDQRLSQVAQMIGDAAPGSMDVLFEALAEVRQVLVIERQKHDGMLNVVADSTRLEMQLALALLLVVPIAGGVGLLVLQHRAAQPLKDLQELLNRLAGHDFRPLPQGAIDQTARLARPAFDSYNALVLRLRELEAEHLDRERLLEQRVREATEALLSQSRELSRAERLAAVGAVSAGFAHELRNPLAGIQLACSKLQKQMKDVDQAKRIEAVIGELKRINHLLTEQVDAARHAPEPLMMTDVGLVIDELLGLLRYQVPAGFAMHSEVGDEVLCLLPTAGLRQALLNLVLNAVHIQGESGWVVIAAFEESGQLLIRVSDEGPGFPAEMLRAGIRPFATGRAGGTGLGLAMVRRFVRDLDGDLQLENRSPRGAQVTLRLPCRATPETGVENDG
jgi:two-component system, NtrC family, sensor kinase